MDEYDDSNDLNESKNGSLSNSNTNKIGSMSASNKNISNLNLSTLSNTITKESINDENKRKMLRDIEVRFILKKISFFFKYYF